MKNKNFGWKGLFYEYYSNELNINWYYRLYFRIKVDFLKNYSFLLVILYKCPQSKTGWDAKFHEVDDSLEGGNVITAT